MKDISIPQALINKQKEYIKLLSGEIDDLAGLAHVHGWRSSRVKQGKKLRKVIKEIEKLNK